LITSPGVSPGRPAVIAKLAVDGIGAGDAETIAATAG